MTGQPVRKEVDTGSLRGALQPVRFAVVSRPMVTIYGDTQFAEGDHVAMQYWGGGNVRITKVNSHISAAVKDHGVHVYEPEHIELDRSGQEI
jgi:hypothetical protein